MASPVEQAIEAAGSLTELARRLEVSPQVVVHWKKRGIPADRVLKIEEVTGVPRTKLRSDLYPKERAA